MKFYIIGSLRNPSIPSHAHEIRKAFPEALVFDDWFSAGPEADDYWRDYERGKGHTLAQALEGIAANHVFSFDKHHLDTSDAVILALPAGRSGHLELGYSIGKGKPAAILMDGEPDRFDVMYRFAHAIHYNIQETIAWLRKLSPTAVAPSVETSTAKPLPVELVQGPEPEQDLWLKKSYRRRPT